MSRHRILIWHDFAWLSIQRTLQETSQRSTCEPDRSSELDICRQRPRLHVDIDYQTEYHPYLQLLREEILARHSFTSTRHVLSISRCIVRSCRYLKCFAIKYIFSTRKLCGRLGGGNEKKKLRCWHTHIYTPARAHIQTNDLPGNCLLWSDPLWIFIPFF